ncbi:MAG TPA: DUF1499 domain-containing protein [Hellea balneolensis]|uniref:DUF1499 domain-containing protein n=1 Tax=Hellea balneolensis TaxID=287478 RepID=A0A7V5NY21_9PROT|nr:DUF1499 domain-containing protein [Hellea balneolensis]
MSKLTALFQKLALIFAAFIPVYFAGAALGTRFGLWDWKMGFGKLTMDYGPKLLILTTIIAMIALILSLISKPRKGVGVALLCLLIPLIGLGYGKKIRAKARSLPFIHDITTDTENPPTFSNIIVKRRAHCANGLDYIGTTAGKGKKLVSELQQEGYPDIKPLHFSQSPEVVFEKTKQVLRQTGLVLMNADRDKGILEATDTSFWFGFSDDVVVRIQAMADGSRVDIRSVSCVGRSDIGVNAARIRKIRDKLTALLKA